eukprot:3182642-Rhodomonas_salina.1
MPSVTVPPDLPNVSVADHEPPPPRPTRQRIEVSESHVVSSLVVTPTLLPPVKEAIPRFAPCSVTITDPVVGTFPTSDPETAGLSSEYAKPSVRLPLWTPL